MVEYLWWIISLKRVGLYNTQSDKLFNWVQENDVGTLHFAGTLHFVGTLHATSLRHFLMIIPFNRIIDNIIPDAVQFPGRMN